MDDPCSVEIGRYDRPESQGDGNLDQLPARGVAARKARSSIWPAEVYGDRAVFASSRQLTGLRSLGLVVDSVRVDVRSRRGFGFYVIPRGFGNPVARGATLDRALAALIKLLAPDIKEVRFDGHA